LRILRALSPFSFPSPQKAQNLVKKNYPKKIQLVNWKIKATGEPGKNRNGGAKYFS